MVDFLFASIWGIVEIVDPRGNHVSYIHMQFYIDEGSSISISMYMYIYWWEKSLSCFKLCLLSSSQKNDAFYTHRVIKNKLAPRTSFAAVSSDSYFRSRVGFASLPFHFFFPFLPALSHRNSRTDTRALSSGKKNGSIILYKLSALRLFSLEVFFFFFFFSNVARSKKEWFFNVNTRSRLTTWSEGEI